MSSLVKATFWSAVHRFGGLFIGFVSNIVLARLLSPNDYGVVGLIMVFVALADVLVDGGLGNALIQKKEISRDDVSTVFTSNLVISIFLFLVIFLSAPSIAAYVDVVNFAVYLRVESIMILLRALFVVYPSMLTREMNFRKLAGISMCVNTLSAVVAISMACAGCGIWSLIVRNLCLDLFSLISYYIFCRLDFRLYINKGSFQNLFGFGFFIAIANLLESLYSNFLSFILGKKFSVEELGYYNQASSLERVPVSSITTILNQVFFPFLSKEQDEPDKMRFYMERSIKAMSFCIYPLMVYLICFAQPIIILFYSEKWLPSVPFFQILCILGFTGFLYELNRSVLKAVGESRMLFHSQVLICCLGIVLIFCSIPYGIKAVVLSVVVNSVLGLLIVIAITGKQIDFGLCKQCKALALNFLLAALTGWITYLLMARLSWSNILIIVVSAIIYSGIYLLLHYMIKSSSFLIVESVLINQVREKRKNQ